MIVAVVTYRPPGLTTQKAQALFDASIPIFEAMPGLIRKYFCFDEARGQGTSVYLWESREAAERCYGDPAFLERFRRTFGCDPTIDYLPAQLVVDGPAA